MVKKFKSLNSLVIRNSEVRLENLFGFLTFKYKMDKNLSIMRLGQIAGLYYCFSRYCDCVSVAGSSGLAAGIWLQDVQD